MSELLWQALQGIEGFVYPNEVEINWSVLIALYPYITGLVAGAFIVASLERVFKVEAVKPTYRLALLTALAFLIAAPLPLVAHLGHPERAFEIMMTPHLTSAMAGFGFIYLWYLLVVLCLEIWFDYRKNIVEWSETTTGIRKLIYTILTLGVKDISKEAVKSDERIVYAITLIGLPSAVFLHGYVGFIFGSVKANPWWASPLMPIIFLFSAVVSGISLLILLYMSISKIRRVPIDMKCLDTLGAYLLYAFILDFGLEAMEIVHMLYLKEESIDMIIRLITDKLFISFIVIQIALGTFLPLILLGIARTKILGELGRKAIYLISSVLILIAVFAMRWNVVIGGQILSKSLRGFSVYNLPLFTREGALMAIAIFALPFIILYILVKILPPWEEGPPWKHENEG